MKLVLKQMRGPVNEAIELEEIEEVSSIKFYGICHYLFLSIQKVSVNSYKCYVFPGCLLLDT